MSDNRTADHLARIAATLGVPVEAFARPRGPDPAEDATMGTVLDLLADPQGARLARAFLDVADPVGRRTIADAVVSIAGAMNLTRAMKA